MPLQRRNPWPYAIIAYFAVFITAVFLWVGFAMRNSMELVRPDYYEAEIRFQQQIDRVHRTSAIREDVRVAYDPAGRQVVVRIPGDHAVGGVRGAVHLYRPSNASLDRTLDLAVGQDGWQRIGVEDLQAGYWKINVTWSSQGQEYFIEQAVLLPGPPPRTNARES